ncbi:DUF126 domain-containing protein [Candidatus Bathyarchaeota archaeon]|nr:DUF126 domain-containing protein [Candidatus Bathyarchaeota archaeon]
MERLVLKGRPIVEGKARGEALVSSMPLNFLKGVDAETGRVIEENHDLHGAVIAGKILCFPHGRGSTVGSYTLYTLTKKGAAPKAIVNELADPVVVVGAIIGSIPMVDGIDLTKIRSSDIVEVDGESGTVTVFKRVR